MQQYAGLYETAEQDALLWTATPAHLNLIALWQLWGESLPSILDVGDECGATVHSSCTPANSFLASEIRWSNTTGTL